MHIVPISVRSYYFDSVLLSGIVSLMSSIFLGLALKIVLRLLLYADLSLEGNDLMDVSHWGWSVTKCLRLYTLISHNSVYLFLSNVGEGFCNNRIRTSFYFLMYALGI